MTPRSAATIVWTSGRWIFTTTSLPSGRVARWTCASDAAASASSSNVAYSSEAGWCSSASMIW